MHELPFAEDVSGWRADRSSPDAWLARTARELAAAGGTILGEAFGSDAATSRAAYLLDFALDGERFRVVWPVLPTREAGLELAARTQAAAMLYHDIKARCMTAQVMGSRTAFLSYLLLPDGRTAAQVAAPELAAELPLLIRRALMGKA